MTKQSSWLRYCILLCNLAHTAMSALSPMSGAPTFDTDYKDYIYNSHYVPWAGGYILTFWTPCLYNLGLVSETFC